MQKQVYNVKGRQLSNKSGAAPLPEQAGSATAQTKFYYLTSFYKLNKIHHAKLQPF